MVVFATVLKRGTMRNGVEYLPEHVNALAAQVHKFYRGDFVFVCFTDFPASEIDGEAIPLEQNWPGWWSKIEVFRTNFPHPGFYLDLDTVIVSDITDFVNRAVQKPFAALDEINIRGERTGNMGSGIMAWREWPTFLFRAFKERPEYFMELYRVQGDQKFFERALLFPWEYMQDIEQFPSGLYSYKFNLPDKNALPADAKIVYFHGTPKPWHVSHNWIPAYKNFVMR